MANAKLITETMTPVYVPEGEMYASFGVTNELEVINLLNIYQNYCKNAATKDELKTAVAKTAQIFPPLKSITLNVTKSENVNTVKDTRPFKIDCSKCISGPIPVSVCAGGKKRKSKKK